MLGDAYMSIEVLETHKPGLMRFLRRQLGCDDTARDVYQSLSERLITAPLGGDIDNPKAYLYRAAANAAHSHRRADKTRSAYETAASTHWEEADARDPERVALGRDALRVVEAALSEPPLLTKRMFIAFRVNGEMQQDIAKRFGVSLSTVEKRIAKATAHCHHRLRESGITAEAGGARHSRETGKRKRRTNGQSIA